ncbi:MAG: DUF5337 domain-containing protein [Rhodobacteraceae bacterium]|nr:DUF5337 domain-containing protein [Paracoccaceae bacterium]
MASQTNITDRKQARIAAIVICSTVVLWLGANWLIVQIGLPTRYGFLLDFTALAAFVWALIVLFWVWRSSQQSRK